MKKVPVSELKPGMKLAKDVMMEDGRLLLLEGFLIKPMNIRKLETFRIPYVYVEDGYFLPTDDFGEEKLYTEALTNVKSVLTSVRNGREPDIALIKDTVNEIVQKIIKNEVVMMQLTGIRDIDNYTYLHSVDVCIYALIVGKNLGFSREELTDLGIGAILHDVGKCKVPLGILQKPAGLTNGEFDVMRLHTTYGYEIARSVQGISDRAANIPLQHHEKWDGSGYPQGLKGDTIDIFARIATVSDIYDALTANRVYKKRSLPHTAADYIMKNASILFDPVIAKVFISNITIYPEGTIVLLSTGEIGSVVSSNKDTGLRPEVSIITRKAGPPVLTPYSLDLRETPHISIVDVLG